MKVLNNHKGFTAFVAALALAILVVGAVLAAETEDTKLIAFDAFASDQFGYSVAVSGDTSVVGARTDNNAGVLSAGSAYVFLRNNGVWGLQAKLTASDAIVRQRFGTAVAIDGDTIVVGSDSNGQGNTGAGSAYVFVRSGGSWTQESKLTASDASVRDGLGTALGISGESIVVGAFRNDAGGADAGSAYVFVRDNGTWNEQVRLIAGDAASSDSFGRSVGISGETVVAGAYRDDDHGGSSGSAYVFVRDNGAWT
jgi:hypothetical protein